MLLTSPCQGEVDASSSMRRVRVHIPNFGVLDEQPERARSGETLAPTHP